MSKVDSGNLNKIWCKVNLHVMYLATVYCWIWYNHPFFCLPHTMHPTTITHHKVLRLPCTYLGCPKHSTVRQGEYSMWTQSLKHLLNAQQLLWISPIYQVQVLQMLLYQKVLCHPLNLTKAMQHHHPSLSRLSTTELIRYFICISQVIPSQDTTIKVFKLF